MLVRVVTRPQLLRRLSHEGVKKERGRVKWFDVLKGYGFIDVENHGDIFVHHSAIADPGYHSLRQFEDVECVVVLDRQGRKLARDVTGPDGKPVLGAPVPAGDENVIHPRRPSWLAVLKKKKLEPCVSP
eukprot:CAMPEP_0197422304 /NCGR_PEP_ID=MMETSP1170-20131217/14779_1 /TAXON_ID=54406 /ORGANISM="Sarcinochrysis sp, Strain CCMP770" /LENGTH=128 /DNA_ID=CAMNT_0042949633 /DNA_START=29 /DNA_END=413 /DNA_ORIENTATION=+